MSKDRTLPYCLHYGCRCWCLGTMLIVFLFEMGDFSGLKEDSTDEKNNYEACDNSGTCKIVLFISKVLDIILSVSRLCRPHF